MVITKTFSGSHHVCGFVVLNERVTYCFLFSAHVVNLFENVRQMYTIIVHSETSNQFKVISYFLCFEF